MFGVNPGTMSNVTEHGSQQCGGIIVIVIGRLKTHGSHGHASLHSCFTESHMEERWWSGSATAERKGVSSDGSSSVLKVELNLSQTALGCFETSVRLVALTKSRFGHHLHSRGCMVHQTRTNVWRTVCIDME